MGIDYTKCDITGMVERHIMIAVDTSANSRRAVLFVGDFFGCYEGFKVTLLHVILEPEATFFGTGDERQKWLAAEVFRRSGLPFGLSRCRAPRWPTASFGSRRR
jgi:hypothetical protein